MGGGEALKTSGVYQQVHPVNPGIAAVWMTLPSGVLPAKNSLLVNLLVKDLI